MNIVFVDSIAFVCEAFPTLTVKLPSASPGAVTVTVKLSPNIMSLVVNDMLGLDFKNSNVLEMLMSL